MGCKDEQWCQTNISQPIIAKKTSLGRNELGYRF